MVQARENWAEVQGEVIELQPTVSVPGYVSALVQVQQSGAVPGFANLLSWSTGHRLEILIPAERSDELALKPGRRLKAVVQKTGPHQIYARHDSITLVDT
jgi:hypothetical protein